MEADPDEDRHRYLVPLGLALVLAPLVVAAIHQLLWVGGDYYPRGDVAATEVLTRDVGRDMLWVGPFSRDGWYHPGPALFYVLALPYRLLGSSGSALSAAALLVNGTAVAGMVALARRHGGTDMALATLLVAAVLLRALGWELLELPWNVYVTVLPYGLLVFLVWAMVLGDRWAWPIATAVASFLVQTHVGYAALALPLLVAGVAWLVGAHLRRARAPWRSLLKPGLCAAGIALVMWLPPAIEELRESPGNLQRTYTWFDTHSDEAQSPLEGWRVVAGQYVAWPEWVGGARPTNLFAEPAHAHHRVVPVLAIVVIGAAALSWRRRETPARALVAVWSGASVLGVLAVARTVGPLYAYRLHWAWVLGMVGGLLVVRLALTVAREWGSPRLWGLVRSAVVVGLAGLAVVGAVGAVRSEAPENAQNGLIAELAPAVRDELQRGAGPGSVGVVPHTFGGAGIAWGLVLDLERHGIPSDYVSRGLGDQGHDVTVSVAMDREIPFLVDFAAYELLAYAGDLSVAELEDATDQLGPLAAELETGQLGLEEYLDREASILPPSSAAAVFLVTDPELA